MTVLVLMTYDPNVKPLSLTKQGLLFGIYREFREIPL